MERVGRYDIVAEIGRGGMGVVYHAHDALLHRDVAVKVMSSLAAEDPQLKARFEREARAAAQLAHPNVVTIYDFGYHEDGSPYIAMELLKGQDLLGARQGAPDLDRDRTLWVIVQVLAALAHAHKAGVIHRDVKPANIFIGTDGSVKVLDFGMARFTETPRSTGGIVGTADYMSPEQVRGATVDGRCDVFSCGCVLFELLAGRRPFHAASIVTTIYKIIHEEPDYSLLPADAGDLVPILERALAKDLESRYATAYEFAQDLGRSLKLPETPSGRPIFDEILKLEDPRNHAPGTPRDPPRVAKRGDRTTIDLTIPAGVISGARVLRGRRGLLLAALVVMVALGGTVAERRFGSAPGAQAVPLESALPVASTVQAAVPLPAESESSAMPSPGVSVASSPAGPVVAPTPYQVLVGHFEGYVTDERCREKGATDDHWDCAETCMRKGYRPLFYTGGKLHILAGVERIRGDKNRKVAIDGRLDLRTNTLTVLDSPRR